MVKVRAARFLSKQFLFLSVICGAAWAGSLGPELKNIPTNRNIQVIIQYARGSGGAGFESALSPGATKIADVPNGAMFTMTAGEAAALATSPAVSNVTSAMRPVYGTGSPVYDFMPYALNQPSPALPLNFASGFGIGVVVVDSGINANADLFSKVVYSENFSTDPNVGGKPDTSDRFGHGTHVAGLIAGSGLNSLFGYQNDIHGVAPGVNLINLKVLNAQGASTDGQVIQAILKAITLKKQHPEWNIKVMNLSLGRPVFEESWKDPLCQAVETAWLNGITVVVAAGNEGRLTVAGTHGYGTIASPGNDPLAFTIGAMNTESTPQRTDDLMTSYSSKGPTLVEHTVKPDLVAPGNKLFAVLAPGTTLATTPQTVLVPAPLGSPQYLELSGTSMAAAVTSGAVAALLANENLTPDQVKSRLMKTAYKLPKKGYNIPLINPATGKTFQYAVQNDLFTVGAGYLDLDAALDAKGNPKFTSDPKKNAASPVAVPVYAKDGKTIKGITLKTYLSVYGKDVFTVWGSDAFTVWGSDAFTVWGSDAEWGSFTVWGSDAFTVWGSDADLFTVWGSDSFTVWGSDADLFTVWGSGGALNTLWSQDAFTVWGSGISRWISPADADAFTVWGSILQGDPDNN